MATPADSDLDPASGFDAVGIDDAVGDIPLEGTGVAGMLARLRPLT